MSKRFRGEVVRSGFARREPGGGCKDDLRSTGRSDVWGGFGHLVGLL